MTDYSKLVEALRCKRDDCEGCGLAFFDNDEGWMCQYAAKDDDAADAIEALQAEVMRLNMRCADCEYAASEWPEDPEHTKMPKRGKWIRVEDGESYHYECSRCGERPLYSRYGDIVLSGVCPMCGAKMEVQE